MFDKKHCNLQPKCLDFNTEGDEVTEDENPRLKEEVLEENIHREKYNFDTKTIDFRGIRAIESMDSLIIHPWIRYPIIIIVTYSNIKKVLKRRCGMDLQLEK